jgi:hypothetical protein
MNEKARPRSISRRGAKHKAAKMAGREIDRLGDQTATREEQHDESASSSKARENFAMFVKTKAETKTLNKRIRLAILDLICSCAMAKYRQQYRQARRHVVQMPEHREMGEWASKICCSSSDVPHHTVPVTVGTLEPVSVPLISKDVERLFYAQAHTGPVALLG